MVRTRKLKNEPTLAEMAEVLKDKTTPRVTLIPSKQTEMQRLQAMDKETMLGTLLHYKRQAVKSVFLVEIDKLKMRMPKADAKGILRLTDDFEPVDKLEAIGVFASLVEAERAIPSEATQAIITELPIGKTFLHGIGEAKHEHKGGEVW